MIPRLSPFYPFPVLHSFSSLTRSGPAAGDLVECCKLSYRPGRSPVVERFFMHFEFKKILSGCNSLPNIVQ